MFPRYTNEHLEYSYDAYHLQSVPINDSYNGYYQMPSMPPTPQFDAIYCSDFTCCGLTIPDLHGLLAHYEEAHCVTFTPDGGFIPVPSPVSSQYSSSTSSPRSTFASSIPPSPVEFAPHGQASAFHNAMFYPSGPYSRPLTTSSTFEPAPPNILTYGSSLDGALGDNWHPSEENKYCLPDTFDIHDLSSPCFVHPSNLIENKAMEKRRLSGQAAPAVNDQSPVTQRKGSPDPQPACVSSSESASPSSTSPSLASETLPSSADDSAVTTAGPIRSSKKRKGTGRYTDPAEKPYKCPKPGCIKTYLNPNGLTYHLKKGTCEFSNN